MPPPIPPAGLELLDDVLACPAAVRLSLDNIARANRWFGGVAAVRFGIARLLGATRPARLRLMDVGAGQGDIARAMTRWLGDRGTVVEPVAVDRHPVAASVARERGLATVRADGRELPLRDGAVDIAMLSQVAHHFAPDGVARLALEATRVARIGVVIADLRPSRVASWGFGMACRVLRFDAITRTDGVVSLARGFTDQSLGGILAAAGIRAVVRHRPGSRIVAYWSTSA